MSKAIHFIFLAIIVVVTIFSFLFIDPNFIYLRNIYSGIGFNYRPLVSIIYLLLITCLFVIYLVYLKKSSHLNLKIYKRLIISITLILLFAYPAMLSYDIFNYSTTARVLFHYQENPYVIMPNAFVDDPFLLYTRATNKVALYGPSWLGISGIPHALGFNNILLTLLNFKLVVAAFYFGTLYLIWKMTKSNKALILFGLSPLILIQILLSGHNDIMMMFFALLATFCLSKRKYVFALVCLLVSILVKYATIMLLPIFLYVLIMYILKKKVDVDRVYLYSALAMFLIFLLSAFREEIYPWYATWFLVFTSLLPNKKILQILAIVFSFSLLLRDLPYMFTGDYFGSTPLIKMLLTFTPVAVAVGYIFVLKYLPKKTRTSL